MNSINCSKYNRNYWLAILLSPFIFLYISNVDGTQLAVQVPNGTKCLFAEYVPAYGLGYITGNPFCIDSVDPEGYYHFSDALPAQTNLSYKFIAYSDYTPNSPVCSGSCVSIVKDMIPTDKDLTDVLWKIDVTLFNYCNSYDVQLALQVPSGTRCLQAVFYPASGIGYTITKTLYIDLLDGQGYFYFCNMVPIQTNYKYKFYAFNGVVNPENITNPTDDFCYGDVIGVTKELVPTDNDVANRLWKIDQFNFKSRP
ncbi:4604_t:CDS:1 [Racocetra fulgida]|uniref:4604_t:CDS:1 n=1 Tax=Racocetra fulgida TaxID=60492 RepID=A0A9N9CZW2_9GLOM|nr:4604_t:CDS:1 [Racocetra fulgida]